MKIFYVAFTMIKNGTINVGSLTYEYNENDSKSILTADGFEHLKKCVASEYKLNVKDVTILNVIELSS